MLSGESLRMNFQSAQQQISSLVLAALSKKSAIDENLANSRKSSPAQKRSLNPRTLEDSDVDPMSEYRKVMEEIVNVASTSRGIRTIEHSVATFEQT